MDRDFNILKETTFTTESMTLKADYEVAASENYYGEVKVTVNITEYNGDSSYLYLNIDGGTKLTGENVTDTRYITLRNSETGVKTGTEEVYISRLEAGATHTFNLSIKESNGDTVYCETTKTITLPKGEITSEDVTLAAVQNAQTPTTVDVTLNLGKSLETYFQGDLYCYYPNVPDYNYTCANFYIPAGETSQTVSVTGLVEGAEYEFFLVPDNWGFSKTASIQLGESVYSPVTSDNTDALHSDLTYQLMSSESLEGAEWKVAAEVYTKNGWNKLYYGYQYLTPENEYTVTYNTRSNMNWLESNTDYIVRWTLYKDNQICHVKDHTFKTGILDVSLSTDVGVNEIICNLACDFNLPESSNYIYLYIDVTERGTNNVKENNVYINSNNSNKTSSVAITGLKADTTYDIIVRGGYGEEEVFVADTITTAVDDRDVTVQQTVGMIAARFDISVTGTQLQSYLTNVDFYYREKESDEWMEANVDSGSNILYLNGLKGNTTYEYEVGIAQSDYTLRENLSAKKTGEFTTNPDERILSFNSANSGVNSVELSFNIENEETVTRYGYETYVSGIQLYYRELGTETWTPSYWMETVEDTIRNLKEETTYEYEAGLNAGEEIDRNDLKSVITGTFSTASDSRQLTVEKVIPYATNLDAEINITGTGSEYTYILFYYREQGTDYWSRNYQAVSEEGDYTLRFSGFEENKSYDYVIGIGNNYNTAKEELKKTTEGTFTTITDDRTVSVNHIEAGLNSLEFETQLYGKTAGGGGYILLYYRKAGSEDNWSKIYRNASNDSCILQMTGLEENTEYEYVIGVGDGWNTAQENLKDSHTGIAKTLVDDRVLTFEVIPYLKRINWKVAITGEAANGDSYVKLFYRKAGTEDDWQMDSYRFTKEQTFDMHNLEENTEYEYEIGFALDWNTPKEEMKIVKTGIVKTLEDDRTISVVMTPTYNGVSRTITLSGEAAKDYYNYVFVGWKEKGTETEFTYCTGISGVGSSTSSYWNGETFKEDTTYEYWVGIGDDWDTPKEEIKGIVTGEFTTLKDETTLESVTSIPGYTFVKFNSFIEKNKGYKYQYLHYFYRKAGQEQWNHEYTYAGSQEQIQCSKTFTGLETGMDYEYIVAVSTQYDVSSPEDITKENCKKTGTFTTKKNEYVIAIAQDNKNTTASKAVLELKAEEKGTDDKIYVTVKLSTGHSVETILSRQNNYKGTAIFTNLTAGAEYTVSEAVISVYEDGSKMEIYRFVPGTMVTTKEGKEVTKISLSKKTLALNLADGSSYIGSDSLKAVLTPQDAQSGILWETSNPNVASVAGGYVQAVGEGTAVITAKVSQNPEIAATCEVTVKNYVVGQMQETGVQAVNGVFYLNQGDLLEGLGLYAVSGDTLLAVEDFKVSVEKNNQAQWNKETGVLTAGNPGRTKVYFEKDGVKAQIEVQVSYKEYSFGLTGLKVSDSRYPANLLGENVYEVALKENLNYMVQGEVAPYRDFNTAEYNWTSSDETVALVSDGIITPVKAGTAVITAVSKGNGIVGESKITVQVKELPIIEEQPEVYVLTSQLSSQGLLKEIPFPRELGEGWKWCEPETAVYNLPIHNEAYEFEAYYAKGDKYPCEESVKVYLGTIKNVAIEKENVSHADVLEVSNEKDDKLSFRVVADTVGRISPQIQWKIQESMEGLNITVRDGFYTVSASKAGTYDLAPYAQYVETDEAGKVVVEETVFTGSYSVTAVDTPQAAQILLTTDTEGFEIEKEKGMLSFEFTSEMKGKKIDLKAVVKDRKGKELEVPLTWKVTDKSVAAIAPAKNDSHTAVLTVKGEGNAVLTVQAKDTAAFTEELDLEFRNYAPRVSTSKAKVNIALDYEEREYQALDLCGGVEIVEAYENYIERISFVKQDGTPETNLVIGHYSYDKGYVVKPATPQIPTGTYKCKMVVETEKGDYEYPMTVTVEDKQPSVKAKMISKVNLFYKNVLGEISITLPEAYWVDDVVWKDNSEASGFEVGNLDGAYLSKKQHLYYLSVKHANVEVENRKLVDANVAKGTLYVKVSGFRELVEIKNFSIDYQYKAPKLKAVNASGNIVPKVGITNTNFRVYDTQMNRYLNYGQYDSYYYYNYITEDNENVTCYGSGSYIYVSGNGKQKKETVNLTLDSKSWREPLQVKYTVKTIEPKAYLSNATLTYNKADSSVANAYVYLKNVNYVPGLMDVEYTPSNAKAKALTEKNIFTIGQDSNNSYRVAVMLNSAEILKMGEELKSGTYSYKLTPYYRNPETGEKTALNTLTLKLKVMDKPVSVKVTSKGTLDLIDSYNWESNGSYSDVRLTYKFKDLPTGYYLDSARLKGEYSEYFALGYNNYYLQISEEGVEKLKAGHTYPITVEYTMRNDMGDTLVVESNVLKIKPKQSTPKVTIIDNNQVLYASNSTLSRRYEINVPYAYNIQDMAGSLDVNKDGRPDLYVETSDNYGWYAYVDVRILDADAINATAKGKAYNIPLTVTFEGRDGISKDVTTNLKVTVKR